MLYLKMKLTKIDIFKTDLPFDVKEALIGLPVYDSSSSPEARVYFIDKDSGYFIKVADIGTLKREAEMTDYFHSIGYSKHTLYYATRDKDILVTEKIEGADLTSDLYLSNPRKLAAALGETLRELHEKSYDGCPVTNRTADYLATAKEGYTLHRFDPSYIDRRLNIRDSDAVWEYITKNAGLLENEVLLHGDFCLPNVIFNDWALSGYIDLGGAGVGDRHVDLFWGAWTLNFNLGTEDYRDTFLDAYGKELVNEEKLLLISAIEAFG